MFRLHRINPHENAREPLPDVLGLAKHGIQIRRGQVTLIAAQPNDGKSLLTLWMCLQWAQLGPRTLYFSADTDEETTLRRAAATVTGNTQNSIEARMRDGWDGIASSLAELNGGVAFDFETDPTYQHIHEELVAYFELWGCYPEVVVVDNLMDVVGDNDDEYGSMRDTSKAFKRFARITGAAFIVLHHCNETDRRENHPPARREITGKVAQKPEMILTVQLDGDLMRIACVKNRSGAKDPKGIVHYVLKVDFERVQFFGPNYQPIGA
jgi:KaiC/GvpD/RAD55 family RecA-like ATPase